MATGTRFDLRLGDCVEGMRGMADGTVDVVVTSPPYNLGIGYSAYRDDGGRAEYLDWTREWVTEVVRLLKPGGAMFLNIGAAPRNPYLPFEIVGVLRELLVVQNTIHWIKSITVETRDGAQVSAGHFKPINSKRYLNDCHEFVFHLTRTGDVEVDRRAVGVPYQDKSNISRWGHTGGRDRRCRGNTWFIPYRTIKSRAKERPHPATFPPGLAAQCVRLHGTGAETVMLDPFLGIGSAALGAAEAGVAEFTGFEIDPAYLEVARTAVAELEGRLL